MARPVPLPEDRPTPALVVDLAVLEANLAAMAGTAAALGAALRPHAKTHKCVEVARRQLALGAVGLSVATVSEAEVFAEAGIDDLFIAYPLWADRARRGRLAALARRVRLRVGVDSAAGASGHGPGGGRGPGRGPRGGGLRPAPQRLPAAVGGRGGQGGTGRRPGRPRGLHFPRARLRPRGAAGSGRRRGPGAGRGSGRARGGRTRRVGPERGVDTHRPDDLGGGGRAAPRRLRLQRRPAARPRDVWDGRPGAQRRGHRGQRPRAGSPGARRRLQGPRGRPSRLVVGPRPPPRAPRRRGHRPLRAPRRGAARTRRPGDARGR